MNSMPILRDFDTVRLESPNPCQGGLTLMVGSGRLPDPATDDTVRCLSKGSKIEGSIDDALAQMLEG